MYKYNGLEKIILNHLRSHPDNRYTSKALSEEINIHDTWGMNRTLNYLARIGKISRIAILLKDECCIWEYHTLQYVETDR